MLGGNKQNYYLQCKNINFWIRKFLGTFGASFIKSWFLYLFCKWFHIRVAEQITGFLPDLEVLQLGTKSKPLLDDLVLGAWGSNTSLNLSEKTEKVLLLKQLLIKAQALMLIISQIFKIL